MRAPADRIPGAGTSRRGEGARRINRETLTVTKLTGTRSWTGKASLVHSITAMVLLLLEFGNFLLDNSCVIMFVLVAFGLTSEKRWVFYFISRTLDSTCPEVNPEVNLNTSPWIQTNCVWHWKCSSLMIWFCVIFFKGDVYVDEWCLSLYPNVLCWSKAAVVDMSLGDASVRTGGWVYTSTNSLHANSFKVLYWHDCMFLQYCQSIQHITEDIR